MICKFLDTALWAHKEKLQLWPLAPLLALMSFIRAAEAPDSGWAQSAGGQ